MSSLPPREQGPKNTARTFNQFAKRDPGLYPLAGIMFVVFAGAGFFLATKSQTHAPEKKFGVAQHATDWENGSRVEAWKRKMKAAEGKASSS